ncbi:hypothetical protein [Paenarthrobacter sp. FR1]|uniref:hypothetical protein n=1 Tax=Paenarthrobacter sp. FR1 TaxID=3439548 RepID=UPI003DA5FCBC
MTADRRSPPAYQGVPVGTCGKLTPSLSITRGTELQLNWLMIANLDPAAPDVNVSAVASTMFVAGKVTVTAQLTNNDTKPGQATFTSGRGLMTFFRRRSANLLSRRQPRPASR